MKLFALETNIDTLTRSLLSANETVVLTVRYHGILFAVHALRALFFTAVIVGCVAIAVSLSVPLLWAALAAFVIWLVFVVYRLLAAYIDWRFDVLIVTDEKLIVVNQSSIFHQRIRQMNMENLATVNVETQFWNIFSFGILRFDLKEGVGEQLSLSYIPHAARVAAVISDSMTHYERRREITGERGGTTEGDE